VRSRFATHAGDLSQLTAIGRQWNAGAAVIRSFQELMPYGLDVIPTA
jgi:hypothetical protein